MLMYVHAYVYILVARFVYLYANIVNLYNAPSGCDDVIMFISPCVYTYVAL